MRLLEGIIPALMLSATVGIAGPAAKDWRSAFSFANSRLTNTYHGVVQGSDGKIYRVNVAIYDEGGHVFAAVGQSDIDGGPDSKRLHRHVVFMETLRFAQSVPYTTSDNERRAIIVENFDRGTALSALKKSWDEREWCWEGDHDRAQRNTGRLFDHSRGPAERKNLLETAKYLPGDDLWIFHGRCDFEGLFS